MSKNIPKLRFDIFTDSWEKRKFGDVLKEFSIKSKTEDEHRILSSTNSGMEFREGRVSGTSNLGYKIIKNGDLVLSPQNLWLGNININNIGKGLVSPSYKTFKFINIDSSFINPQLRTQKMLEEYKNSSTQGASVVRRNLEIDSFYQIPIFVPTISEQIKIGSFFRQLDRTITLHQRKLDLLKEQKKGFLQKMFPKAGEQFPELRFEGFTDAWEQRKFMEIIDIKSGRDYKHLKDGDIPVYGTGGYMLSVDEALSYDEDAIGIGRKGTINKPYLLKAPFWTVDTLFYAIPIKGNDLYYINNIFQKINWKMYDESTGVPSLSKAVINKVTIMTPTFEEQQKIGSFFKQLDNTITLQERKLDSLKEQKKGFLQQMFV